MLIHSKSSRFVQSLLSVIPLALSIGFRLHYQRHFFILPLKNKIAILGKIRRSFIHGLIIHSQYDYCQVILTTYCYNFSMNSFKNRLKELRQERNLTQSQVAEALRTSPTGYANWEQGRREPDIDGIIMLCHFFNVTAGYLLGIEES